MSQHIYGTLNKQRGYTMWEEKCWGHVEHMFESEDVAVSRLRVKEGWRCSCHRHKERANIFTVQDGALIIEEWREKPKIAEHMSLGKLTLLRPGMELSVPTGIWHRFRVLESGNVVEFYWTDNHGIVSIHDIERIDEGGEDDLETLRKLAKVL